MELKNIVCSSEQNQWAKAFSSDKFKQAKRAAKETDHIIIKIKNRILHFERIIQSTLSVPHIFINKWQFDEECGWVPSDQINWRKAIALSPLFVLYHIFAAPRIVYDQISKYAAERTLEKALEKQKQIPDPRLLFGKLNKLMEHPEQLKAASEQGLAPSEFVDFVTNNLDAYRRLKSLPSGKPWKGQIDADPQLVEQRKEGMAPIRERFTQLQKEIYRIYAENKIQRLTRELLQQNPDQKDPRKQAIDSLKQKYEKKAPHYYLFAHTPKEYKSYKMVKVLEEL